MLAVDRTILSHLAPTNSGTRGARQTEILDEVAPALVTTLSRYGITTRLRIAHFLAQVAHESDGFCTTVEYASGKAYEGRADLGNSHPGDGVRFKGRGLIQLTGRANYQKFGGLLQLDLVNNPELAADPDVSLALACAYWNERGLNDPADDDDLVTITKRINGGTNGLDSRSAYLKKAKSLLVGLEAKALASSAPAGGRPVLARGAAGDDVAKLQNLLRARGFLVAVDADFGAATELAVITFQRAHGLDDDGIVGPATWSRLG